MKYNQRAEFTALPNPRQWNRWNCERTGVNAMRLMARLRPISGGTPAPKKAKNVFAPAFCRRSLRRTPARSRKKVAICIRPPGKAGGNRGFHPAIRRPGPSPEPDGITWLFAGLHHPPIGCLVEPDGRLPEFHSRIWGFHSAISHLVLLSLTGGTGIACLQSDHISESPVTKLARGNG